MRLVQLSIFIFAVVLLWWASSPQDGLRQPVSEFVSEPESVAEPAQASPRPGSDAATLDQRLAEDKQRADIESDNQIRESLRAVADAYREDMRFPPYSKPLSLTDTALLNPRAYPAVSLPVSGQPGMTVRLELGAYIADLQAPLPLNLVVSSEQAFSPSQRVLGATVSVAGPGGNVSGPSLQAQFTGADIQVLSGAVAAEELQEVGEGDITLLATINFADGSTATALASARTYQRVATLVAVDQAYVEGPHLTIPLRFIVGEPGFYRVQANLFSEEGGTPVSHLSARFELTEDAVGAVLQAHVVTLQASGSEGPYRLSDVNVVRVPSRPGEPLAYGTALADSWSVPGYAFDRYSAEHYMDPRAEQRLQFLQSLQ